MGIGYEGSVVILVGAAGDRSGICIYAFRSGHHVTVKQRKKFLATSNLPM